MTSRERWVRIRPFIGPALERKPEERAAYLDDVCGGDEGLRAEALRLIHACERARDSLAFLDSPAVELAAPLLELEAASLTAAGELVPGIAVGPYVLERYLGAGGMGVVYLARDPRLDRQVALKLLPAWLPIDDEVSHRLTEEARAASRLDHPNIQTVYEIGRTPDERPFIAMAYYEGETLKDRLAQGPLEVDTALELACQMADGLGAAHAHGIVHRDVKPGNVIVTPDGTAKILDFGAAKISGRGLVGGTRTLGTVTYMSPEQTQGEDVDARTDVWSLGVVLHEMLTGRRPFGGDGPTAVIHAIRHEEPEPLRNLGPDATERLARVVARCLEKDPKDRFREASAVSEALLRARDVAHASRNAPPARPTRRLSIAAALTVATLFGAVVVWPGRPSLFGTGTAAAPGEAATRRLGVLPVAFPAAAAEDEYLAGALTEELIAGFSRVRGMRVTALGSASPYQDSAEPPDEIARKLGVEALLAASLRKEGDEMHLSVRLLGGPGWEERWADDYTTEMAGLPSVVNAIVEDAAGALELTVTRENGPSRVAGTENVEALELYYRGRHFLAKLATPGATQEARTYFERALDLDPTFAPAWSGLSGAYHQLAIQVTLPARDAEPRAREAAERALEIDPDLAEAHVHLAAVLSWYYWDADGAERHFRRAIELDPSSARAHQFFAVHLRNHGRFDEALDMVRVGAQLDPLSPGALDQEGEILYHARRYDESLARYHQLLRVEPTYAWSYFFIALANIQLGRYEEALDALDRADPRFNRDGIRGYALGLQGRREEAYRALARLDALPATGVIRFNKAILHVGLGELDTAIDLLEEAIRDRPLQLQLLGTVPEFDPLRSDPRFLALLEELGFTG